MLGIINQPQLNLKMTSLGNFVLEYKTDKSNWLTVAREMSSGQLLETAKEIVERTLIYHQADGEPYSALSCPVRSACAEELMRRQALDYRKLMRLETKALKRGETKRKKRVKNRS